MKSAIRPNKTTSRYLNSFWWTADHLRQIRVIIDFASKNILSLFIHEYIPFCFGRFEAKADKKYNNYHVAMKNKLGESEETKKAAKH